MLWKVGGCYCDSPDLLYSVIPLLFLYLVCLFPNIIRGTCWKLAFFDSMLCHSLENIEHNENLLTKVPVCAALKCIKYTVSCTNFVSYFTQKLCLKWSSKVVPCWPKVLPKCKGVVA